MASRAKMKDMAWLTIARVDDKLGMAVGRGVVRSFRARAFDSLPLYITDASNKRSEFPELAGGIVKDLRIEDGRLQALVEPRTEEAKRLLTRRPTPKAVAEIIKDYVRAADETHFGPTLRRLAIVRPAAPTNLTENDEGGLFMETEVLDLSVRGAEKYTPEQWREATLVHTGERDSLNRGDHHIPVRTPDGKLDPALMKGAVAQLFNASFDPQLKRRAAQELIRLFREIDDNPPDSLKGLAGRVERADLSVIEDVKLAAIELSAESASDEFGVLLTEKVARYAREHDMTFPDARQALKAALSGDLRRDRDTACRIQDLADERGIEFADAAEQDAIERATERQREAPRSWNGRPSEEREQLIREEAAKQGYDVG